MATFEPSPNLDPKVAQAIQDAMAALRAELMGRFAPKSDPVAGSVPLGADGADRLTRLEAAVQALDSATGQTDLLAGLLKQAGAFADRALFLIRDGDDLKGWAAFGFAGGDDVVDRVTVLCPDDIADLRPSDHSPAGDEICDQMAAVTAADSMLVPFALRGKVAGALYTDRTSDDLELDRPALRILCYVAAQALETLPLRRPAAVSAEVAPAAEENVAVEHEPAFEIEAEVEVDAEVEVEVETEDDVDIEVEADVAPLSEIEATVDEATDFDVAPEPEAADEDEDDSEDDFDVDMDVDRMIEEVERGPHTAEDDTDIVAIHHGPTPTPLADDDEGGPFDTAISEVEREDEPTPTADETFATQEISTVAGRLDDKEESEAVAPLHRSVEDAEVAPPADLDGPGWAFSGAESISDDTRFEEARRLARLLVTEIKLYNEEKVRQGRENNDLYEQLRDDIERSRRIYEERIDDEVHQEADYFQEEVVRILAGGDSTALGL